MGDAACFGGEVKSRGASPLREGRVQVRETERGRSCMAWVCVRSINEMQGAGASVSVLCGRDTASCDDALLLCTCLSLSLSLSLIVSLIVSPLAGEEA